MEDSPHGIEMINSKLKTLTSQVEQLKEDIFEQTVKTNSHQTHFPIYPDRIGYRVSSKIPTFWGLPPMLTTGQARTISKLTLPCKGVWLINYEIVVVNLHINGTLSAGILPNGPATISNMILSVTLGDRIDTQSIEQIVYLLESQTRILPDGENLIYRGSEVYNAETELTLSFNIQCNFTGRLFIVDNGSSNLVNYNLSATRIA